MRWAELTMAGIMAIFSLYLMWKSAELPIGWLPGEGPGGGAFPFWLSAGMFICSLWVILRWIRKTSSLSRSTAPYMEKQAFKLFLIGAGSLAVMIGSIHIIGVYGAVPLFLIFYMRVLGRHSREPALGEPRQSRYRLPGRLQRVPRRQDAPVKRELIPRIADNHP